MSTGYTHKVQTGEVTDFSRFAMQCARAFGALIEMRDDPMDANIPDKFAPSSYHDEALARATERESELLAMSTVDIAHAAEISYREQLEAWTDRNAQRELHRQRYQATIDATTKWQPPEICAALKTFMLEQLQSSVEHDCSSRYDDAPKQQGASEWLAHQISDARHDIQYHTKERLEEIARVNERNLWLSALRVSLVPTS